MSRLRFLIALCLSKFGDAFHRHYVLFWFQCSRWAKFMCVKPSSGQPFPLESFCQHGPCQISPWEYLLEIKITTKQNKSYMFWDCPRTTKNIRTHGFCRLIRCLADDSSSFGPRRTVSNSNECSIVLWWSISSPPKLIGETATRKNFWNFFNRRLGVKKKIWGHLEFWSLVTFHSAAGSVSSSL